MAITKKTGTQRMKLGILTPSRQRPGRLDSFIRSVHTFASNKNRVYTCSYIDNDDPRIEAYKSYYDQRSLFKNDFICTGPPQSVSKSWNILIEKVTELDIDVVIMGNDDMLYRTNNWDVLLEKEIEKYPDQIYCMWFEDMINGPNHCAFPIVSYKWIKTLGYYTPGHLPFKFLYNDTWIFDLGKRVNRCHFIPNVVNEHLHFTVNKSSVDETTKRNRGAQGFDARIDDKSLFEQTVINREQDAKKLQNVIDEYKCHNN